MCVCVYIPIPVDPLYLSDQDFHEMSHGLLLWLENIDRRRNQIVPIDTTLDRDTLQERLKTLSVKHTADHLSL